MELLANNGDDKAKIFLPGTALRLHFLNRTIPIKSSHCSWQTN